ncbi:hypothetical protein LINPERHAP2_LOCUS17553 [Linum perenne]
MMLGGGGGGSCSCGRHLSWLRPHMHKLYWKLLMSATLHVLAHCFTFDAYRFSFHVVFPRCAYYMS